MKKPTKVFRDALYHMRRLKKFELLDKELKKDTENDKNGILDIKVRLKNKAVVDVEIQGFWTRAYTERTLTTIPYGEFAFSKFSIRTIFGDSQKVDHFYWSKMYVEDFEEGDKYSRLHKCITINIVGKGFNLNNLVHSKYLLKEETTNEKLTNLMEIHCSYKPKL